MKKRMILVVASIVTICLAIYIYTLFPRQWEHSYSCIQYQLGDTSDAKAITVVIKGNLYKPLFAASLLEVEYFSIEGYPEPEFPNVTTGGRMKEYQGFLEGDLFYKGKDLINGELFTMHDSVGSLVIKEDTAVCIKLMEIQNKNHKSWNSLNGTVIIGNADSIEDAVKLYEEFFAE